MKKTSFEWLRAGPAIRPAPDRSHSHEQYVRWILPERLRQADKPVLLKVTFRQRYPP